MSKMDYILGERKQNNALESLAEQFLRIPLSEGWHEGHRARSSALLDQLKAVEVGSDGSEKALQELEILSGHIGLPHSTIIKVLLENLQADQFDW
jgi:hypothetical protein